LLTHEYIKASKDAEAAPENARRKQFAEIAAAQDLTLLDGTVIASTAAAQLAAAFSHTDCRRVLRGHENAVYSAAFSPDGAHIVTASEDHTARIWDAATGSEFKVLRGHTNAVRSAAFSPNGTRVVTASEGTPRI
jgi:WD40 repeat protein